MGHHHFHHSRSSNQPPTTVDKVVVVLCCGVLPLLFGVVFAPIGIYNLAEGDPNMASFGWIFTVIGVLMTIAGIVALVVVGGVQQFRNSLGSNA